MSAEWSVPAWAVLLTLGVVALLLVGLLVLVRRSAARASTAMATARTESEALRAQVSAIEDRLGADEPATAGPVAAAEREYVITRLGDGPEAQPGEAAPTVDGPLFADLVLRESVVQAASFAAGLRRAFAPEHLNRIRFEMRREVKRARKQRRTDLRRAKRDYDARTRTGEAAA